MAASGRELPVAIGRNRPSAGFVSFQMKRQIKAVIVDDETMLIEGRKLVGTDAVADVLRSALQSDPNFILVIAPTKNAYYKGIGTVIYASQRVGVPVENLRYTTEEGDVVRFDELRARNPTPSM
jgi:hypothetical protein